MDNKEFDLGNMLAEDLIRIREQWRKSMANLPFEWKIAIVKKLQSFSGSREDEEKSRNPPEHDNSQR